MDRRTAILLALLLVPLSTPAHAHYLWLEPVGEEAHLCFGEYENALREKTGGRLDSIEAPEVRVGHKSQESVALRRRDDHLLLEARAGQALIARDAAMPVKDLRKHNIGIVKPMYYARFAVAPAEEASDLALDIRPVGAGKVHLSLHGKALAGAKLQVYAPNRWMREVETDAAGNAVVAMPWPGLYVIEAVQVEPLAGRFRGETYEAIRHVGTLSLMRYA